MILIFFYILIVVCVYYDLRYKKIPNILSLAIFILGLAGNTFLDSQLGFIGSLCGLLAGFLCSLLFYIFASLGAGDVKLISAIGSVIGYKLILPVMAYSYVVSAFLGIFYIKWWVPWYQNRRFNSSIPTLEKTFSQRIPMAPGISIATVYVLYSHSFYT